MTRTLDPVWNHFKKSTERKTDQAGTKQRETHVNGGIAGAGRTAESEKVVGVDG